MKEILPNLLKALGVALVSAFILFLFYPKDRIKDQVLNTALEVLGNKLLAMVPKENEQEVRKEFEAVRTQALEGRVNEEHFEQFVTVVLNAEAEGRPLPPEKIDSSLAALRRWEFRREKEAKSLQQWAERMHAFEKFQTHWQQAMADSGWAPPRHAPPPRRPLYRIGPNFVVKIDTAALAEMAIARRHALMAESLAVVYSRRPPPPLPPHMEKMIKELDESSKNLPLKIEYGFTLEPDSFRFEYGMPPHDPPSSVVPPGTPVPPTPPAEARIPGSGKNTPR